MAKTRLLISKVLVKAIILSFITILLTTIMSLVVMLMTPSAVYHKIFEWMVLNRFNPEVYYTDYYRRLSLIANEEDWMLVTPLSYLLGGVVFGYILGSKRERSYVLKTSAITAFVFTALVLIACYYSSPLLQIQSANQGVNYQAAPYKSGEYLMGVVQTVYWTAVYLIGSLVGNTIRSPKQSSQVRLPSPTIAA